MILGAEKLEPDPPEPPIKIEPGVYRHFRGTEYRVFGVGKHSETDEQMVVYQSFTTQQIWVRPAKMFFDHVTREGYTGPRFIKLEYNKGDELVNHPPFFTM